METGGDIYRVGSLRRDGSSSFIWRNTGDEVFNRSINGGGGGFGSGRRGSTSSSRCEEELTWAALERLPTYNRLTKAILPHQDHDQDGGGGLKLKQVDLHRLAPNERRMLLERLVKVAEEDNERFLLKIRDRIDRVGIEMPTVEVRFENLNVETDVHVGSRGLPTVWNFAVNMVEGLLNCFHLLPRNKQPLSILQDLSGIISPKKMTLVLGPPGSGKTTFLLALAGRLDPQLKVSGKVTYNGHEMNEFIPQKTAAYISQHDLHIGEMTVRETLAFSARCQGVGTRYDMIQEVTRREKEMKVMPDPDLDAFMKAGALEGQKENVVADYIMKILGLDICADIKVGDAMHRGISGGQRKRLTTGEMLVGPARVLFMDEISTGLDSSTTYQIVNSISQYAHILGNTPVISLLQPAPETFELFDDVILLSDGYIVYQGPRENILYFFESMGFRCPERKGVADFLQEVTSRNDQRQYWVGNESYAYVSVKKFSEAFKSFSVGKMLEERLKTKYEKNMSHPAALATTKYGVSMKTLLSSLFWRERLLMKRNSFVYVFKLVQIVIVAFIVMTLFLRTEMHRDTVNHGQIYMGALYFGLMMLMFASFSELSMTIGRLPVFFKQRDMYFYPAWTYTIPSWVSKIPISIAEVCLWVFLTYYVIGFDPDPARMFRQLLVLFTVSQMASGLFRFMASLGRDLVVANTFGTFAIVILILLGGFILSRDDVKPWWIWGYWISPLMYGQNAVAVNEFLGNSWQKAVPNMNITLGEAVLEARGMFTQGYWYWLGVGVLIGYVFLFNGLSTLALSHLKPLGKSQGSVSEEALIEKHANITGEILSVESSSRRKRFARRSLSSTDVKHEISAESQNLQLEQVKKGMVLPFKPLAITFEDIRYAVDMPTEIKNQGVLEDKLELLKGVSGSFRPGILTALMGVSGAGKTTLMDVLAGRKTGGYMTGNIKISGYPKKQETFARIAGYCEQNDIHSPHVTVYESLLFSAWLRLPPDVDDATKKSFIEEVMNLVELSSLRGSIVGLPGANGLSTEQRKRLTIAVELVANPSIIFMDEPTSGLDARAAAIVIRAVRNTVDTGRTVVCTIHQPSIDIFEAFDELFLMKRGGEEMYVGPLGHHCSKLIRYFEEINGVAKIRDRYNPATWMLEVTSEAQEAIHGINFAEIYKKSELYQKNREVIKELSTPQPGSEDISFPTMYSQSFVSQFSACLWKQHCSYWRDPSYTAVRLFFTTFTALIIGTMFWGLGSKRSKEQDLFNAMGSMYAAVLFIGINNSSSVQPVVSVGRSVFYRERAAGMYSELPYALGQVVIEIPYVLVQSILYSFIVYAMIQLEWTAAKFLWYLFLSFFTLLYFTYYGMMSVGLTPNHHVSAIASSAFYAIWNLFSGFVIPRPSSPIWWRWFYWISPISWTLYGLVGSQFGDLQNDLVIPGSLLPVTVAQFIDTYFGYKYDLLWLVAVVVVGFAMVFAFSFALSIKVFNYQRR